MNAKSLVVALALSGSVAFAQEADDVVQLGRMLFSSPKLSANGRISCATCHAPARAFVDGLAHSKGVLGEPVSRNTPTLWGAGTVTAFPGARRILPDPDSDASVGGPVCGNFASTFVVALSLEERCLAPIENPAEMGVALDEVVRELNEDAALRERFDAVFGASRFVSLGVTQKRLGSALAAFIRSQDRPRSRYRRFQDGETSALTSVEKEGLAIFMGIGKCATCHSGRGLTDGRMHIVRLLEASRDRGSSGAGGPIPSRLTRRMSNTTRVLPPTTPTSGYGVSAAPRADRQTLSLWEVRRTAPYFRDGSVPHLGNAVRLHARELREVVDLDFESAKRLPAIPNTPVKLQPDGPRVAPDALDERQLGCLIAFLNAL